MGAEVFQMYLFKDDWKFGDYKLTWYSDEDSDTEPCNARSTSYCANMAAAFIVNQIKKRSKMIRGYFGWNLNMIIK